MRRFEVRKAKRRRGARKRFAGCAATCVVCLSSLASAEPAERGYHPDRFSLVAKSESHVGLFQRALLPGPRGTLITTETVVPLEQYVLLDARGLDTGWDEDSVDVEFSGYGQVALGALEDEQRLDGDIQTFFVRYRRGPAQVQLGRQIAMSPAARYVRFDGAAVGAELGLGLDVNTYGGFTVLPRWNRAPGYASLGGLPEARVEDPRVLQTVSRSGYWLAGGRLGYSQDVVGGGLSFHEQREDTELARRNLGLDLRAGPWQTATLGSNALFDTDATRFADARVWVDAEPWDPLNVSVEYLHTEPALLLSRQSVLSVFGGSGYEEVSGSAELEVTPALSFEGEGGFEIYDEGRPGSRGEVGGRFLADRLRRVVVRLGYARLIAPENGYQSLRGGLSSRLMPAVSGTLEVYAYFYDEAIRGYRSSTVYAGTLGYQATPQLDVLWGGSIARSPYASLDAQTQLRLRYAFDSSLEARK
ncbi:MAG: hypothetical protein KC766_17800 [Myxococcales bacterium]|nr:hypothetical protein [Myxococcales bacterium]